MSIGLACSASQPLPSPPCAQDEVPARSTQAFERWRLAGMRVRLCVHPDEPRLVNRYLAAADELHIAHGLPRWEIALETAWLLVAVAADRGLPMHWRCLCLDHVHRPLAMLVRLADDDQRWRQCMTLRWELSQLDLDPTDR